MADKDRVSFSITEPRFDKNTYWGRVASIAAGTSIFNAFKTKAEITKMQELLAAQKKREAEQFARTGSYKMEMSTAEKA